MTTEHCNSHPYFVISIVRALDKDKVKRVIKRFVSKHIEELKECDDEGKMFKDGKFLELKGSAMSWKLKKEFATYLAKQKLFEVFYIVIDNSKIKRNLYKNVSRAFNYVVKLALGYFINHKYLPLGSEFYIQIDERNDRPEAKLHLQEFLNTTLQIEDEISGEIKVEYFDSCNNCIIQLSDFFANLMYSQLQTDNYKEVIDLLANNDIIKTIFKFPID